MDIICTGVPAYHHRQLIASGVDIGGTPVTTIVDDGDGWPLRCCLTDSRPGDRLAIVAFSPFDSDGPYRETGPVVIHAQPCGGTDGRFPDEFEARDQVVRAFGHDDAGRPVQVYDRHRLVRAGEGLRAAIEAAMADDRVEQVHVHNVLAQCLSFTVRRAG